jgi:MFS family permease
MAAWALRYVLFAFGAQDSVLVLLITGIALHGVCYDFFFVSGQIYTDSKAGEQYKSSAQGLITLATYGLGMLVGFKVAGVIYDQYALASGHDWKAIWLVPAALAAGVFALFALAFKPESIQRNDARSADPLKTSPRTSAPSFEP